jgi:hypothetical protein
VIPELWGAPFPSDVYASREPSGDGSFAQCRPSGETVFERERFASSSRHRPHEEPGAVLSTRGDSSRKKKSAEAHQTANQPSSGCRKIGGRSNVCFASC